jgi:hypothetical protein
MEYGGAIGQMGECLFLMVLSGKPVMMLRIGGLAKVALYSVQHLLRRTKRDELV